MTHQPFLKSIQPINLLSFGPDTEPIELRPLNILIGPNGCGKSNLIEVIGLLSRLPDKDPWSMVIETGGAREWTWKGKNPEKKDAMISVTTSEEQTSVANAFAGFSHASKKSIFYSISVQDRDGAFEVQAEQFHELDETRNGFKGLGSFERNGRTGFVQTAGWPEDGPNEVSNLSSHRSSLSMIGQTNLSQLVHRLPEFVANIEKIRIYRDWVFGPGSQVRAFQQVGYDSHKLERDSRNMAQVLKAMRDRGNEKLFDRLVELLRTFYEPTKDVDTELLGTLLRIMIREKSGFTTPATRLSDGTLRWLYLLIVLLDPAPPPLICIDEPDLGLHPDIVPTLADLLRDASTRTQLIITTHSRDLVECFSDDPSSVLVCEKENGATTINRLDDDHLGVWLKEYSLGQLWSSGQIGGNRW